MDTRKLLVADASASFCAALTDALGGEYELRVCSDGLQARGMLASFQPDILMTDLALPGLDGISLLKCAACASKRPAMLVTTRFCSTFIENAIDEIGIDYLMYKPCDIRTLAERLRDLSQCGSSAISLPCTRTALSNVLLTLGLAAGRKGYGDLELAIERYQEDPNQSMTKVLYPAIGKLTNSSGESVERAIRGVIHSAWANRDEKVWRLYFAPGRDGTVPRPTNRAFIATLAEVLGRQEQRQA